MKILCTFLLAVSSLVGAVNEPIVELKTSEGTIELKLFPQVAPKTVENFIGLVQKGYYNNTIFHRVIPGFMLQGGDPKGDGTGGESLWGGKFKDEFSPGVGFDKPYLLAMANAGPNTNGSQFFITVANTPWLNNKHTIFGEVIKGKDVVNAIEAQGSPSGKTKKQIKIISASVLR